MNQYRSNAEKFLKTGYYIGFVLFVAILGYGFAAVNPAVNVDSLTYGRYLGLRGDLMKSGRFGGTFWSILFGYGTHVVEHSFTISIIGIVLLIWAGINYCLLFQKASRDTISMPAYTVFSACLISYPLMNEIWGYQGAIITICGGHLLGSFALLLLQEQIDARKWNFWMFSIAIGMMAVGISAFESYPPVYVFLVFAILWIRECQSPDWKKHLIQGLWYCFALVLSLIAMAILRKLILVVLHLEAGTNGATTIYWLSQPFGQTLRALLLGILNKHILTSVLYFPLLTALICSGILALYGLWLALRRRWFSALLVLGMLFSLELLSIVQGAPAPLRACPVFAVLVAFIAMIAANVLRWRNVAAGMLCFFCLHQSVYMNQLFTLNHLRYEQEQTILHNIGRDLTAQHDLEKPVVFIGACQLSGYVMDQALAPGDTWGYRTYTSLREQIDTAIPGIIDRYEEWYFPQTNIQSVINWASTAFDSQEQLEDLFHFFGYPVQVKDEFYNSRRFAQDYALEHEMPGYPREGYIAELEDQIIVNLG